MMKSGEYGIMYEAEDTHWWYLGMAQITRAVLNRYYAAGCGMRILDAGCGAGAAMTTYLADYGQVTGVDLSACALSYSILRKAERLVRATVASLPFKSQSFDLVTSFDVLSDAGVLNDLAPLIEFSRLLIPGGRVILRLPAYSWLRGRHDQAVSTQRRYVAGQVSRLLEVNGFKIEFCSYVNTFLFPFIAIKRFGERFLPSKGVVSDLHLKAGRLNGFFTLLLKIEAALINKIRFPFGLSVIIVGRKE